MLTKENGFALPHQWIFPEAKKYAFTFLSLFIILIAIYSNSFYGEWHFDDFENIVKNQNVQIKSFSWSEIKQFISSTNQIGLLPRQLSYFSFALNYAFGGTNVFGYHVVNFIIHYLAAIFLFLFIYNTFKLPLLREKYSMIAYPAALLATFLWAIHPVFVTSVTYIVQRMASMAGMFYIMSMYFYLKARTTQKTGSSAGYFVGCALAGLCALLSKQNAIMLPVSLILFDIFLIQGLTKANIKKFSKILFLPLLLAVIIGLVYTVYFSNVMKAYEVRDFSLMQRVLTEPRVILFYLSLLFYPIGSRLTLLYDIETSRSLLQPWTTIPSILTIILIIGFAFYLAKRRPFISFCIIFYFLNHLIEGSLLPLELIYEHRNYLPAMLLFVPIAEFIIFAVDYFSYRKLIQFSCALGAILIVVGLGDITYRRNAIFRYDDSLWLDNIVKYPNLSRPHGNLGNTYIFYGLKEKGLAEYEKAASLNTFVSNKAKALNDHHLGSFYFEERQYEKALPYFEKSYLILKDYISNPIHIAKIKLSKGKIAEAGHLIESELRKNPQNPELLDMFSLILLKAGRFNEAEEFAKMTQQLNPAAVNPLVIRAEIARKRGNYSSAIRLWNLHKKSAPLSPYVNLALIELYQQTNNRKMLAEELARLACFQEAEPLKDYLTNMSRDKNLLIYIPDVNKIIGIVKMKR